MGTHPAGETVMVTPPVAPRETPAQREARVEAAVDRMLPRPQLGGFWFTLLVIACFALSVGGVPTVIGLLIAGASGLLVLRDVRQHVRVRERAEREVAAARRRS
jgi:hypothetical protein